MIRHLFKMIWNRKKSNFLLISEIFFSFLVLFAVLSLLVYYLNNYAKPLGFTPDNPKTSVQIQDPVPGVPKREKELYSYPDSIFEAFPAPL